MTGPDAVFRKCALRIVPFVFALFMVNFLDRVNVAFAALTMNRDLHFSPSVYGLGAGMFFLGYFAFQLPSNLLLARLGARLWMFAIVLAWGLVSTACAFVQGATSFYVLRLLLGAAEAGLFPGVIYYFTLWFPQDHRGRLAAAFIAAGPLANIIGGPLSTTILATDGFLGLHGWQWLFLIEGAPACLLAFAALKVMPDSPQTARWLSAEEKQAIADRLAAEDKGKKSELLPALFDARVLALSAALFGIQSTLFGVVLWLPQIVQSLGFSTFATGFVIVPPYLLSMIAMVLWGRSSDRGGERILHTVVAALLAVFGLFAAALSVSSLAVLIALSLVVIGIQSTLGPVWGVPSTFLGREGAAGGIALINALGSLGGFVAPTVIGALKEETGGYAAGLIALALALIVSCGILLLLNRSMPSLRVREHASTP
jgi:ACS family tartrate transporter-like MFS transporter